MQSSDRHEFDGQMARLCAGYNVPAKQPTLDAYWIAFNKLSLLEFSRMVDQAFTEGASERMPTIAGLWQMRNRLRAPGARHAVAAPSAPADSLPLFANRLLLMHLMTRQGLGSTPGKPSAELNACLKARDELVDEFSAYILEGESLATPREFLRRWVARLKIIGGPITDECLERYREMANSADGRAPFPASYVAKATIDA
jgi:hypothetical protein